MSNGDRIDPRTWKKASRSTGAAENCVEVGHGDGVIGVRDTKDRAGGTLAFSTPSWRSFLREVKTGQFDL